MELRDGFTLCWREAAIKRLALFRHVGEKLRRLESLPASFGEIVPRSDKSVPPNAVNVRNIPAGKRRKAEAENRTDIGLAHIGHDPILDIARRFKRLNAKQAAFDDGNRDVMDSEPVRLQIGEPGPQALRCVLRI